MPTTFVGLILFVAFLTPGFLYTSHRRRLVPYGDKTPLMETTSIVSISLATNAATAIGFAVVRVLSPDHTPELAKALDYGTGYWLDNLAYMLLWSGGALALSCLLAVFAARCSPIERITRSTAAQRFAGWKPARALLNIFDPATIVETSSWNETFFAEDDHYVHLGLQLQDGDYLSGRLVWFSTELEETSDRDLVLGAPLTLRYADAEETADLPAERTVVSARQISRIDMTPVAEHPPSH